ncbi:MAG TPA: RNA methyltransferase [Cytophagaceae bacterium]|jgi:23S rRNA (guanosine2251-2'-O)-methyltransferase|nr:RNA methyltransferase [Cytophagaceae bacterium]
MRKLKLEELNRISTVEFKEKTKTPVVLVLDNIRSLHNVGAAFRTGDAFLIHKIYLCGITGTPPNRELHKSALGAEDTVEWEHVANSTEAIKKLQLERWKIISIEQAEGSIPLQHFIPEKSERYCFVFGNEVFGVEDAVIELSDACVEIPQFGTKHSFNVSVSMGIVLWDYFVKTRF